MNYCEIKDVKRRLIRLAKNTIKDGLFTAGAYSMGTVSLTNGSDEITISTATATWPATVSAGWTIIVNNDMVFEVNSRVSDSKIEITENYSGVDISGATHLTGSFSELTEIIEDVSGEIDGYLAKLYTVPFTSTAPSYILTTLKNMACNLVVSYILERWYAANSPEDSKIANSLRAETIQKLKDMTGKNPAPVWADYFKAGLSLNTDGSLAFLNVVESDDTTAGICWSSTEKKSPEFTDEGWIS